MILVKGFKLYSFKLQAYEVPVLLFFVSTFLSWDWVICARATHLARGSHFSDSHSGTEP